MFKIYDGRDYFYQWDVDRKLIVNDAEITQVHFCNRTDECSLVCETYQENGLTLVNVPNVLLQSDWRINVYAYNKNYTKFSKQYPVVKRSKPDNYVYTETEVLNYYSLDRRIRSLESGGGAGGGTGEDGATFIPTVSNEGVISWTNNKGLVNPNPVNIKGANGKDGLNGVDGRGITRIEINADGELIIYYTDNTVDNLGVITSGGGSQEQDFEKPILYGTYILKENINWSNIPKNVYDLATSGKGVYCYFYDDRIKDYHYKEIDGIYILTEERNVLLTKSGADIYIDESYDIDINDDNDNPWESVIYLYDEYDNMIDLSRCEITDIKGRVVKFTKPILASDEFYEAFVKFADKNKVF